MDYIIFFLLWLLILSAFRSFKISYKPSNHINNKSIMFKHILKFILYELKVLLQLYLTAIGIYIVAERIYKYGIFPATTQSLKEILVIVNSISANNFVLHLYVFLLVFYGLFFLPVKIIKSYNQLIKDTQSKDYLHNFIIMSLKKFNLINERNH